MKKTSVLSRGWTSILLTVCLTISGCAAAGSGGNNSTGAAPAAAATIGADTAGEQGTAGAQGTAEAEAAGEHGTAGAQGAAAATAGAATAGEQGTAAATGILQVRDGKLEPILTYTDLRDSAYTNEGSDILRYCVYVETDNDTDNDGKADLVKVLVQVPRAAAEGKYKAGTIYDPTPYGAGTVDDRKVIQKMYVEKPFDYQLLYKDCEKRTPVGEASTLDVAAQADPREWNYKVPGSGATGFSYADAYDYYLVRGYAVVEACGIGTYGSEGFELCSRHLERDSHKAVVEWLTGDRTAYTDKTENIAVKADWSNGRVAMTGVSYGGTLPFEVATTGVKGLTTIVPIAGIASWYDYTNRQGVPIVFENAYLNDLAAGNSGATFLDDNWTVPNREYGSWLWQIAQDQEEANGDFAPVWEEGDYAHDTDEIACPALIVQGLNDYNVSSRHMDLMKQAFDKAGMPAKLIMHQNAHSSPLGFIIFPQKTPASAGGEMNASC